MVEVPRTHSAKLLLLNLVMVGVPTNTFTLNENNPNTPGRSECESPSRSSIDAVVKLAGLYGR